MQVESKSLLVLIISFFLLACHSETEEKLLLVKYAKYNSISKLRSHRKDQSYGVFETITFADIDHDGTQDTLKILNKNDVKAELFVKIGVQSMHYTFLPSSCIGGYGTFSLNFMSAKHLSEYRILGLQFDFGLWIFDGKGRSSTLLFKYTNKSLYLTLFEHKKWFSKPIMEENSSQFFYGDCSIEKRKTITQNLKLPQLVDLNYSCQYIDDDKQYIVSEEKSFWVLENKKSGERIDMGEGHEQLFFCDLNTDKTLDTVKIFHKNILPELYLSIGKKTYHYKFMNSKCFNIQGAYISHGSGNAFSGLDSGKNDFVLNIFGSAEHALYLKFEIGNLYLVKYKYAKLDSIPFQLFSAKTEYIGIKERYKEKSVLLRKKLSNVVDLSFLCQFINNNKKYPIVISESIEIEETK